MVTALNGMKAGVILVWAWSLAVGAALAGPPLRGPGPAGGAGAHLGPPLTEEEKSRIAVMPEKELAKLLKSGSYWQQDEALATLVRRDGFDTLMSVVKAAPAGVGDRIIESYQPKATAQSDPRAKQRVDRYVEFLEQQLGAKSPVVSPDQAARSLGHVAFWHPRERDPHPFDLQPAPRYQHQRIVNDLSRLVADRRPDATDALGLLGGCDLAQAPRAVAALTAGRMAVAARFVRTQYLQQDLRHYDDAVEAIRMEETKRAKGAKRIAALSEQQLVELLHTGHIGEREAAVTALVAKNKGSVLLAIAKAGPKTERDTVRMNAGPLSISEIMSGCTFPRHPRTTMPPPRRQSMRI